MTDLMPKITMSTPLLRVVFGTRDDPDGWSEVEIQTTHADLRAAEQDFVRHKMGKITERPMKYLSVMAWRALRNTGQYDGTLAEFEKAALDISNVDDDAAGEPGDDLDDLADLGAVEVDPTNPAAGPA